MNHRLLKTLTTITLGLAASAPGESFVISLEDMVSDGVPGPGAGVLGVAGEIDTYAFTATAGTLVYFDEIAGPCNIGWSCDGPSGQVFSDGGFCLSDPQTFILPDSGDYTITVSSGSNATGAYSFVVWEVNPDQPFEISFKDLVSDGVPSAGAGNIEEPGTRDVYTFDGVTGQEIFFDELSGSCSIGWTLEAPDASVVFSDGGFCLSDPGAHVLDQTGTYTLTVDGEGSAIGTYSFTMWEVNPDDFFSISLEETVSDGAPGAGAGNIEEAGTSDVYELTIASPTTVYADELSGNCGIAWTLEAPDSTVLFSDGGMCLSDPQLIDLDQVGTYTITVTGEGDSTGAYSFILWDLNPDDLFSVGLEEIATGNIEEPGTRDVYTLTIASPTTIFADELSGNCGIAWSLEAPDTTSLFTDGGMCLSDPQIIDLDQVGTYTITVDGENDSTGAYSFELWEVNPDDVFVISLGDTVSDGDPGVGAGNIEEPGTRDVYTLLLEENTDVCFVEFDGNCGIAWDVQGPAGELFSDGGMCLSSPGTFAIPETGIYTITVDGEGDAVDIYSFKVRLDSPADLDDDCDVDFSDLVTLLAAWGTPNGDVDGDGDTGFQDLVTLLAAWG